MNHSDLHIFTPSTNKLDIAGGTAGVGIPFCDSTAGSQYRGEERMLIT